PALERIIVFLRCYTPVRSSSPTTTEPHLRSLFTRPMFQSMPEPIMELCSGEAIGLAIHGVALQRRSSSMATIALITGASRGLGLALARGLAARGWRL